jgi:RHS repeat-associated protein
LSETGTQATAFTVSSTSNRLTSTSGFLNRSYAYDAVGNALSYEDVTLTYNNRNRLAATQKSATTRSYVYNALGQLAKAAGGAGGTVHYVHDEAGHLIGEYDAAGALIQETVWLGDTPVATLRPGSPVEINYVHADHLGTPVRVTRSTDNARRWQWNKDPFGTLVANENPDAVGSFVYNLRFPGQLFDGQAGLHQNMYRDYSPAIGRYVESDPIGLDGGINTYSYVGQNPVARTDPTGQFWQLIPAAAAVVYSCYTVGCVKTGIDKCALRYPGHKDPLNRAARIGFTKCQQAIVTVCASLGAYGQDPIGSAAGEIGAEIGKKIGSR